MQIEVKGRNVPVNDELRELVERKFRKVAAQVSDLARMEVELSEERNPAIAENQVAEVILYLKGATLRAEFAAREQARIQARVQRLHATVHDLREAREVLDRAHLEAGLGQLASGAAGRDDLHVELAQTACQSE